MTINTKNFDNPVCQECIKNQIEKYKEFVDDNGIKYDNFAIQCTGIPINYVPDELKSSLTQQEIEEVNRIFDPVAWAEYYVKNPDGTGWKARYYQELLLRCTAKRKVSRMGRRLGKSTALVMFSMHYLITNKNKTILVAAPYKSQSGEIFDRIKAFSSYSPLIADSIKRCSEAPYYEIEFYNGSKLKAFSTGTKSGSEAGSIRGQDADIIILDESDRLTDGDMQAITAIVMTTPDVVLWASSTPTGKRGTFYNMCLNSPMYKEFYYPSMVLPHWKDIEAAVRADFAGKPDEWEKEILAKFGEKVVGVFQNTLVDGATTNYKYEETPRQPGWIYGVGVDWNSNVGTEICITGFDTKLAEFKVVETINIPKQGWTQIAGMEAVIAANNKWQPRFIYVDAGYGSAHHELLRKYGYDIASQDPKNPAAKLKDIVKAFEFGGQVEIHDPVTRQPVKKPAKPYLVENAVRRFEEGRIKISSYDTILRNQLLNYIIKHRTQANVPTFASLEPVKIGDHRLDAFMLSLVCFQLEMTEFGNPTYSSKISISNTFNSPVANINVSRDDKEFQRLAKLPKSRYNENARSVFGSKMPGVVRGSEVPTSRQGWDTDEEAKYARKYQLKQMRRTLRGRRTKPSRSNI